MRFPGCLFLGEGAVDSVAWLHEGLYCGWLQSPSHGTLKPCLKPLLVGIYRGIIMPGFLGWYRELLRHDFTVFKVPPPPPPSSSSKGNRQPVSDFDNPQKQ